MANLVETILGAFSPNAISQIAALLGESGSTTGRGLAAVIPVVLAGAVTKSKSAEGADLLAMVNTAISGGNPLDTLGSTLSSETSRTAFMKDGSAIVSQLLGAQGETIANAIAGLVGAKPRSVESLLAVAAPLALGALAKGAGEKPNAGGISAMLANGNSSIYRGLPPGLRSFFSLEPPGAADEEYSVPDPFAATLFGERKAAQVGGVVAEAPYIFKPKSYTLAWVLLGAGVLALLFSMVGGKKAKPAEPVAVVAAVPGVPEGEGLISEMRNGRPMLIIFFRVAKSDVTNEITPESAELKTYMDANPDARLSVSGYVDPTGDAAFNEELSKNRAQKVLAALVAAGIAANRIDLDKPADITPGEVTYSNDRKVEVKVKDGMAAAAADAVTPDAAVGTAADETANAPAK